MTATGSLGRAAVVGQMLARDLSRRRLTLALVLALPLAFYASSHFSDGGNHLTAGGIGVSWGISGAALFATIAARGVDQRLVLDGYRPVEVLLGRAALLLAGGLVVAGAFAALMLAVSDPPGQLDLLLAMLLVALISVPLGLAVGALVPRELEGVLLLIGVIGIQIGAPSSSAVVSALPLGSAQRLLDRASYGSFSRTDNLTLGLGWLLLLTVLAAAVSAYRLRTRARSPRSRWYAGTAAGVTAAVAVALIALPGAAAGANDANGRGQRAVTAVLDQWGACLRTAGVPLSSASGRVARESGTPGLLITFGGDVTFFVPDPPNPPIASADSQHALTVLAAQAGRQPPCHHGPA